MAAKRMSPAKGEIVIEKYTIQEKFQRTRKELNAALIERDGEVDVVLTALLCKENPLLVGPPGTAKSMLLDSLMGWMGGGTCKFSVLLNKFTTPEEVFGPISVQGLKNDVYRRITTDMLPDAHVAFLDEIFKASSAILNTMLKILNERTYAGEKCPLLLCVAASNEWPGEDGKELGALFDRFLLRKTVEPIKTLGGRDKLLWTKNHVPELSTSITPDEIKSAQRQAASLEWTESAQKGFMEILDTLAQQGVLPGDRRKYKSVRAVQAFAYLNGSEEVKREHLDILAHTLWDDPEQAQKCGQIVAKVANPTAALVNAKLSQIQDVIRSNGPTEAVVKLGEIEKELEAMPEVPKVKAALKYLQGEIKALHYKVVGVSV